MYLMCSQTSPTIGIPRALQYFFYDDLWLGFFDNIGIKTVVSPQTNKEIIQWGVKNSIDEACFSSKLFIGHVQYLLDKCDMLFVPRIENTGIREEYCTRIFGLYDLVKSTFPSSNVLTAEVNYLYRKKESNAFVHIGNQLGKTKEESLNAYQKALDNATYKKQEKIKQQQLMLDEPGTKVLIFSHAYNTYDAAIGKEITDYFTQNDIKVAYADLIEEREAKALTKEAYGKRVYWKVSAELMGGIEKYRPLVDGIVLISTFPCGPDSIFNELLMRRIKDTPILSLIIDEQDASAGIQTRLESFTDIISAKGGKQSWLI